MIKQFYMLLAMITAIIIHLVVMQFSIEKSIESSTQRIEEILFDVVINDTNKIDVHIVNWHLFTNALMFVESNHNPNAVGQTNDAGVLQITPIYVKEVNRILGQQRFTLEDRFDKYKSIEMFTIMNDKYNPERSFYKAMRLHNPHAPESYRKSILNHYYKLKQQ